MFYPFLCWVLLQEPKSSCCEKTAETVWTLGKIFEDRETCQTAREKGSHCVDLFSLVYGGKKYFTHNYSSHREIVLKALYWKFQGTEQGKPVLTLGTRRRTLPAKWWGRTMRSVQAARKKLFRRAACASGSGIKLS